ncbi:50S ribosomal protein L4 [Candidatus Kuenenbacteria bacterium]|nr:50S ribosomal protein L4 [Candidatus Kuenenbacteria bacterium]
MSYPVYNQSGEVIKEINLNPSIFAAKINEALVHQIAVAQMANKRQNLAHTKTKDEVRGGGKKPWRQKGTGRARHGSTRSPLWKGGGVTFGPRNDRDFTQKINKKMKRGAIFSCLSDKAADKNLIILENFNLPEIKTKEFGKIIFNLKNALSLKNKKISEKTSEKSQKKEKNVDLKKYSLSLLVASDKKIADLSRAGRNIPGIKITNVNSLNVLDLLRYKNLILTEESLPTIEKIYLKNN